MRLRGEIKDGKLVLDEPVDMADGQRVEVTIRREISLEEQQEALKKLDELRKTLEKRWGGKQNFVTQDIREDRGPI